MRHGTTGRRHRHRGGNNNGGGHRSNGGNHHRMQVFDSNGPDVRIRGTAHQVCEKYLTLARDSASAGDRIVAENYLQHAEHYQRIINSFEEDVRKNTTASQPAQQGQGEADGNTRGREDLALPASILGANPNARSQEPAAQAGRELTTV
ncbi:MAG: DUF4167 domain-containing protein [Alphaproteobacteria bacterium]